MIGERDTSNEVYSLRLHPELVIQVHVLQERQVYGRTDVLVAPVAGGGTAWVQKDRLEEVE